MNYCSLRQEKDSSGDKYILDPVDSVRHEDYVISVENTVQGAYEEGFPEEYFPPIKKSFPTT